MNQPRPIIWFRECSTISPRLIGEKGTNLGRLHRAGLPIPDGFVIPSSVLSTLLDEQTRHQIRAEFSRIERKYSPELNRVSQAIQQQIQRLHITDEIAHTIAEAHNTFPEGSFFAVRSSRTISALPSIHATYLNIYGDANLFEAIKKVWASLFSTQILEYAFEHLLDPTELTQAVVIQKMVDARVSGLVYSKNPENNNKRNIVIDAIWGLGEYLDGHPEFADRYEVEKNTWELINQSRHAQLTQLTKKNGRTEEVNVPDSRKFTEKLSPPEMKKLGELTVKTQQLLFFPQQIEWALENDRFLILQTNVLQEHVPLATDIQTKQLSTMRPLLYGTTVHPGLVSGQVRLCKDDKDYGLLKNGEVLVTNALLPHAIPNGVKLSGIISDTPVQPRDAHILGAVCIGNTRIATQTLRTGQWVTLYGQQSVIYDGKLITKEALHNKKVDYTTRTKLYLSIDTPHVFTSTIAKGIDGIGILRAEKFLKNSGAHPKSLSPTQHEHLMSREFYHEIQVICDTVHPKPVWYRFSDLTTHELLQLEHAKEYEVAEENPLLGYHGTLRHLTDLTTLQFEITMIKNLREAGYQNLHLVLPFVRSLEEFVLMKSHLEKQGLRQSQQLQLFIMVETPATALEIESYFAHGLQGAIIGAKRLQTLFLGLDQELMETSSIVHDIVQPLKKIVTNMQEKAEKYGKELIYYSDRLDRNLLDFLIGLHIHGVCVDIKQLPFVKKALSYT